MFIQKKNMYLKIKPGEYTICVSVDFKVVLEVPWNVMHKA